MKPPFDMHLLEKIKARLLKRKETIAVAESVTAGLLQNAFSQVTDATQIFHGGITTYNLGQKVRHLNVEPIYAEECNCVSDKVSAEMALNVSKNFVSHWAIASTGYATPVPELSIKKIFVLYAISHNGKIVKRGKISSVRGNSYSVQLAYTDKILQSFYKKLVEVK
jgi:nicotinamide-nucleotide amidase